MVAYQVTLLNHHFQPATQDPLLAPYVHIKCILFCLSFKALSVPTLSFKVCSLLFFKLSNTGKIFHRFIPQINIQGLLYVSYWARQLEAMQKEHESLLGVIFLVRELENKQ